MESAHSVRQALSDGSDTFPGPSVDHGRQIAATLQARYDGAQVAQPAGQKVANDHPAKAAPSALQPSTFARMRAARRWLLASPDKVPHYVNGQKRNGKLDSPDDQAQLASYEEAAAKCGSGWLLGFALGPDGTGGYWQGIDLDDIPENQLSNLANALPGYVERSPSGNGCHAIGYGAQFSALGSNSTGIEAYSEGRYFTFTGNTIRDNELVDLAPWLRQHLSPHHQKAHGAEATESDAGPAYIDPKTVTELRSALSFLHADDYDQWVAVGQALKGLGQVGRGLWLDWSQSSIKWKPSDARKWTSFNGERTAYQAVFAKAQAAGWVNPGRKDAQLGDRRPAPSQDSSPRELVGRTLDVVQMRAIDWLWTGWIPKGYITLLAGETGAGKSTVLADIAARVTTGTSWPGESQPREPGRILWLGSEDSIEEMTAPRLVACGANRSHVVEIQGVKQQGKRSTFSMQDDLDGIRRWLTHARDVESWPFAMLVIDPVTSYLPGQKLRKVDLNDAGQLRTVLEPWLALAQEYNIAIVCVTHFAKDTSRAMLHRVLGSAAFAQTCRSLCSVIERPATEEYEPGPHEKVFMQVKVNLPEHPGGAWKFRTVKVDVGTDVRNGKVITATRPEWEELESSLTPKSMVGGRRGPVGKLEAAFGVWFTAQFVTTPEGHWQPIPKIKEAALAANIVSERWWNEHSGNYMEKQNFGGVWHCRPKKP